MCHTRKAALSHGNWGGKGWTSRDEGGQLGGPGCCPVDNSCDWHSKIGHGGNAKRKDSVMLEAKPMILGHWLDTGLEGIGGFRFLASPPGNAISQII